MSNESYCYSLINKLTGMMYIGKANDVNSRWGYHRYLAKTGNRRPLYQAIRKYGIENFEVNVIGVFSSEEEALCVEAFWIDNLREFGISLYNVCETTKGGFKHSQETKIGSGKQIEKETPRSIKRYPRLLKDAVAPKK